MTLMRAVNTATRFKRRPAIMSTTLLSSAPTQVACNLHVGGFSVGSSSLQLILGMCGVIAAVVFVTMIYSIVRFRTSPNIGLTSFVHRKTTEILWALIPIAILVGTVVPT